MGDPVSSRMVMGTAGHIDHGKTALVRALTGVDTDRLKEEKERGITIELGFAPLTLPDGRIMSVVDVPGHERFVKNMVAGASGIDILVFVIAADEGVMPQTREHLDICSLLGIKAGIVALTKADLVEMDMMELVREEVAELVSGTFLEGAPVYEVSAVTGQGIAELKAGIAALASKSGARDAKGLFRLPVDRVFTIKGFGTVVTGTMLSGSVKREDEVEILPSGKRTKVRGVEVHGSQVEKAYAGNRVALNFAGMGVSDLARGDTVVHAGELKPTRMADARLTLLKSSPALKARTRLRLHIATREVPVVVSLLEGDSLLPGDAAYVQLRSPEFFMACPGDRFVLRGYSPAVTVGGGVVLDQNPKRHKGVKKDLRETLGILEKGAPLERLEAFLKLSGAEGLDPLETQLKLGTTIEEARNLLQAAVRKGAALVFDRKAQRHVHAAFAGRLEAEALRIVAGYHADFPMKKGMGTEELRSKFPSYVGERLVQYVLTGTEEKGLLVFSGDSARLPSFKAAVGEGDRELLDGILGMVRKAGYEAPTLSDLSSALGEDAATIRSATEYLAAEGLLTRTKEGFFFDTAVLARLAETAITHFETNPELTVADIKEFTGATRKYVIPLAEYLDSNKITFRKGVNRVAGAKGRRG